jgi:hypothetical protein
VRLEGIFQLENSNDLIGTRDLPARSIMTQPTTLPRGRNLHEINKIFISANCSVVGDTVPSMSVPATRPLNLEEKKANIS